MRIEPRSELPPLVSSPLGFYNRRMRVLVSILGAKKPVTATVAAWLRHHPQKDSPFDLLFLEFEDDAAANLLHDDPQLRSCHFIALGGKAVKQVDALASKGFRAIYRCAFDLCTQPLPD